MVRIPLLPDLSRFIRRSDKVKLFNTVHLLIGETSIEVSGAVLSLTSPLLEGLVGVNNEVYLDQFVGEEEGVQDVVEMMYGGEVELGEENVKTLLKFAVVFEVKEMYEIAFGWVKEHISRENLFGLIQSGLVIETVGNGNHHVLDVCTAFIVENIQDELVVISNDWSNFANNIGFAKFLIQDEILLYSLPVLTAWVSNDSNVNCILIELEDRGLTKKLLHNYGEKAVGLLDRMGELVKDVETSKKLLKIHSEHCKKHGLEKYSCRGIEPNKDIGTLLDEDYLTFTLDKLLGVEKEYGLDHFQYVDIITEWIESNNCSKDNVVTLLKTIRPHDLGAFN